MKFEITAEDSGTNARVGRLTTPHGIIDTPAFMPVGTAGTVKGMTPEEVRASGAQIILGNTFHLYLRPGTEVIRKFGGLHNFMGWDGPILTDSGGYQVFSLAKLRKITSDGVLFRSPLDGSEHFLTPEGVIEIQGHIGSDIIICLDECIQYPSSYEYAKASTDLTIQWALRSKEAHISSDKGLFCVLQGGYYKDLREYCTEKLVEAGFDGYAIGGVSVGEPKDMMYSVMDYVAPLLPWNKPRYLMGVGHPDDIIEGVARGIDMFDCVVPTRHGRRGFLYTRGGHITIKNSCYKDDESPVEEGCSCYTCGKYSRAYLRHLIMSGEFLGPRLNTIHNLHYFGRLMQDIRGAIAAGRLSQFREDFYNFRKEEVQC
ncbi:MAG: tRNA guanosine(34) transglycosylase Tgt [Nitrospirae bacterium]|nr:tRNA guanosine(34) transglycosylase Tgt [Nitrospirota bacterium]